MSRPAGVPSRLAHLPFRGSIAIASGLLTRGQLAGPSWRRLFRDVYIHTAAEVDPFTLCAAAALLLPPGAAISHSSAAALYGVKLSSLGQPTIEVTVPHRVRMKPQPGLMVHRANLEPEELCRRGGLPSTVPSRIAFDLGRDPDFTRAVVALDALLYQRVLKPETLRGLVDGRSGWPGAVRFRRAAALARPDVESPMETRLRLTVIGGGLPEPAIQHDVFDPAGHFVARLDLAYDDLRVGLEYDGDHHRERDVFQRDAVRLNRLKLLGWTVLRFTAADVLRNPDRVLAHVRAALKIAAMGNPRR